LFIFNADVPGKLEDDQKLAAGALGKSPLDFAFRTDEMKPTKQTKSGEVRIVDSRNFKVTTTTMAMVTVRPGGMRELHWHPNADEWQYYIKGKARMGVFNTGPNVLTMDFNPGDIGYIKRNYGHYVQNVGDTELQFFAVFRTSQYEEMSLSDWLRHSPPEMVAQHLNVDEATISKWPSNRPLIMPA
jgi:oxalate decarboxylase